MVLLEVKNLSVEVGGKTILKDIHIQVSQNETMILFGPNGSGKTTLLKAIMGLSGYTITKGEIFFAGERIDHLPIEERVKRGLGIMYQHPPKIRGVKLAQLAGFLSRDNARIKSLTQRLSLESHMQRDINMDFSGGEIKRSELCQMLLQDAQLLLLDEPESGVDLENISIMGGVLNEYLKQPGKSALIITHTGYILDYIKAQKACMMFKGKFWCTGRPKEMFESIRKEGYEKCKECADRKKA